MHTTKHEFWLFYHLASSHFNGRGERNNIVMIFIFMKRKNHPCNCRFCAVDFLICVVAVQKKEITFSRLNVRSLAIPQFHESAYCFIQSNLQQHEYELLIRLMHCTGTHRIRLYLSISSFFIFLEAFPFLFIYQTVRTFRACFIMIIFHLD